MADGALVEIARWRAGAPTLAEEIAGEWQLELGAPYVPGAAGHVVRATCADGTPAVLKLFLPHREAEQEADALERWAGAGAVRLLRRNEDGTVLLLERCEPGTFLSSLGNEGALDVLVELLPRLWISPAGFATLEHDERPHMEADIETAADPNLRDRARGYVDELASSQGELVLVHQDLHGENVLAAQREPWLVIDPKPLAAEREFAVAPIVRSPELGHSKREALYRLDRLTSELGLDRERARGWTIAQTIAWSGGSDYVATHMETVEWLR